MNKKTNMILAIWIIGGLLTEVNLVYGHINREGYYDFNIMDIIIMAGILALWPLILIVDVCKNISMKTILFTIRKNRDSLL